MSQDLFMPALGWRQNGQSSDNRDEKEEYPFPEERTCRQILRYALREGKSMTASGDYEDVEVFQIMLKAGLRCYWSRLYQFEEACESFKDDPESIVIKGLEIIRLVTFSPRKKK